MGPVSNGIQCQVYLKSALKIGLRDFGAFGDLPTKSHWSNPQRTPPDGRDN